MCVKFCLFVGNANMSTTTILLFLFVLTTTSAVAVTGVEAPPPPSFMEAPQFYNSPHCPPPLSPPSSSNFCSPSALVHVAMTLDVAYLRGSLAAILSILHHTSCPQSIQFHFVASTSLPYLTSTIKSTFPYLSFHVYYFDPTLVSDLISVSIRPALDRPLNYARSYLSQIFPLGCPSRVVYLDSDIVLVDDIVKLSSIPFTDDDTVLAAPEYCKANFTTYFTPYFWSNSVLSLTFEGRKACYFNTGVMVIDLDRWRKGRYTERIEEWMEMQKRTRIYQLGSLPSFLLVFAGRIAAVDHRWNQHGLGGDNYRGLCRDLHTGTVSLLHWSGKGKPWTRLDSGRPCPLDALWAPYDLLKTPFSIDDGDIA